MHLFAQSKLSRTLDDHTWGESTAGLWLGFCWPSVQRASPAVRESTLFWCRQLVRKLQSSLEFWPQRLSTFCLSLSTEPLVHTLRGPARFFPELGNFLFLAFNSKFPRDTQNYSSWKVGIFLFSIKIWGPSKQFFFFIKVNKIAVISGRKKN